MDRRGFLKSTGVAGILAAGRAPAFAQGTKLHLLRWNDFIPACDVTLREKLLPEAIQSGNGADIIMTLHNWPHLYQSGAVDMTDVAEWQAKDQGGFYQQSEQAVKDGKRFLALPWSISGLLIAYRKSWFAEVGASAPPKTLEEYRELGMKLKKKGHP